MEQSNLKGITSLRNLLFLLVLLSEVTLAASFSDSVLIGGSGPADSKAQLDVKSTTKGVLLPRMTTTQQNSITSPTEGLLIYDNVLHQLANYNGTSWTAVGGTPAAATSTVLGTVKSTTVVSHQFLTGLTTGTGAFTQAQPAFTDISGNISVSQMNSGTSASSTTYWRGDGTWVTPTAGFASPMTTLGDIIYEDASPAAARLAGNITTTKKYLSQTGNGSISAVPSWAQIAFADISGTASLTTQVSGALPIANGGTGQTAKAAAFDALAPCTSGGGGLIVYGSSTNSCLSTVVGDTNKPLISAGGSGPPVYGTLSVAGGGTGLATVATGDILYASASNTLSALSASTSTFVLTANGAGVAPSWQAQAASGAFPYTINNCSIATSVASSALTIALKDSAGSNPAVGSPCKIAFRNATAATGTYTEVSTTAAASVVVPNGQAIGCTATAACTIYIYAINNAGTVELAVIGQSTIDEGTLQSSTAIATAPTTAVLYSTTARTTKPVRLIGRINITPAAAFAWTANSTEISSAPYKTDPISQWGRLTTACTTGTCTMNFISSGVSSVTRTGTGGYSINFVTGTYSVAPACSITAAATTAVKVAVAPTCTTSACTFLVFTLGAAAADDGFSFVCTGNK